MDKQVTISVFSDELAQVRTKKKEFLAQIERIVPWKEWLSLIQPCYYKGERGNKPYPLEIMLRLYLLQNLYDLSDEATVAEAIDSRAFSDFWGLILKKGTIVDSTIIAAPSSTKNKEKKRDPEAHQVKKGNTWHFGYKAHIGVDKDSGLVHTVEATAANVHDVTEASRLLTGDEDEVYGGSGYLGAGKREDAVVENKSGRKIQYKINLRPSVPNKEAEQRRTSSRQRSGTRKVICTSKSGTRIRGREEAAAFPKDTIPRP